MSLPSRIRIVEVGPRDGLQNEKQTVSTATKLALIQRLADTGLSHIEATAFVSPKWVPQMADAPVVMSGLPLRPDIRFPVLTPNLQGLVAALEAGAKEVAVFTAASESFSRKNINCSIAESLERFEPVMAAAKSAGIPVRGYVSCALVCPFEGAIDAAKVAAVAGALFDLGCYEISLGDTIGLGTPAQTRRLVETVAQRIPVGQLAGHFHDTYGLAIANIWTALECGVSVFDASVAGLGGCPYAPGAAGNVATEDVVFLMHTLGIETGIDLPKLVACSHWISQHLGRPPASKVAAAMQGV